MRKNPARFSKRDANHEEVRGWYEALFVHVVDTHTLGFGFPDFVISCSGVWDLVEVKTEDGELTAAQLRFTRDAKAKVVIIRDQQDVVEHVQRIRTKQATGVAHGIERSDLDCTSTGAPAAPISGIR